MAEICNALYERPDLEPRYVRCTFLRGHESRHSWESLREQEEADRARRHATTNSGFGDDVADDIQVLLDNILIGRCDPYIEAILTVAHNRKRALRGERGFPDLGRRRRHD